MRHPFSQEQTVQERQALSDHFQSGPQLNAAVTACACIQLGFAYASARRDGHIDGEEALELVEGGIGAGTSIYSLAARHAFTVEQMQGALGRLDDLIGALARPVVGFFAILSIAHGYVEFVEALEARDTRGMVTAGFTVASGIATAAGAFTSIPYAQPIGVALGIIAAAIGIGGFVYDETRPPVGKELLLLARIIERSHHLDRPLLEESSFGAIKRAYESLEDDIDYGEYLLIPPDQDIYRKLLRVLHDLGHPYASGRSQDSEGGRVSAQALVHRPA